MIRILDDTNKEEIVRLLESRSVGINKDITAKVEAIIERVAKEGDQAVRDFTMQFDGVQLEDMCMSQKEIDTACSQVSLELMQALEEAAANIRSFHEQQKQRSYIVTGEDSIIMGQRVRALHRVGLYVPGGTAAYPSSVLMNAIPAKVAGVQELIMVTPPSKDGKVNPNVLAAAKIAGVDKIYNIGGAQAVAALALGTESIPKVDKIVGPGNIFVATAKRLLYGTVDIDMIAGPSEILIVCDESADPKFLAADMMSQAEHDKMASSIVLCTTHKLAEQIDAEVQRQLSYLSRTEIIRKSLEDYGVIVVCDNVDQALELANQVAPEHLELMLDDPFRYLGKVENAGSIFMGHYSPEPLGDYFAGPNHVLPTNGTARFFSPLSVDSFIKKSSYLFYSREALAKAKDKITTLAHSEGLDAHANSITVRFED